MEYLHHQPHVLASTLAIISLALNLSRDYLYGVIWGGWDKTSFYNSG